MSPSNSLNAVNNLKEIKPKIYCKGPDYLKIKMTLQNKFIKK